MVRPKKEPREPDEEHRVRQRQREDEMPRDAPSGSRSFMPSEVSQDDHGELRRESGTHDDFEGRGEAIGGKTRRACPLALVPRVRGRCRQPEGREIRRPAFTSRIYTGPMGFLCKAPHGRGEEAAACCCCLDNIDKSLLRRLDRHAPHLVGVFANGAIRRKPSHARRIE